MSHVLYANTSTYSYRRHTLHHAPAGYNNDQLNIYYSCIRYLVSTAAIKITITLEICIVAHSHRINSNREACCLFFYLGRTRDNAIHFECICIHSERFGARKREIVLNEVEVLSGSFICIEMGLAV